MLYLGYIDIQWLGMNSTCLKHYEMIFVIVRLCIRKITLVRVSTLVTGNPKILVINVYASYVYPCQPPPPRSSVKPLHLGSNVRDPYPTDPSQVATLPHLK